MVSKKLIYLMLAGALLAGCSDDDTTATGDKAYPLVIKAKVYSHVPSEDATTWTKPEDVTGVYVLKSGTNQVVLPHANLGYYPTPTAYDDYFQPADVDAIPYFPPTGEEVWDVAVYYPRTDEAGAEADIPLQLEKQGPLKSSSLLYGRATSLTKENRVASMRLTPALSRLVFYFRPGSGVTAEQLADVTVDIEGMPTAGSFNVLSGKFTADAESVKAFRTRTAGQPDDTTVARTCEAFVMPAASTKGCTAVIQAPSLPDVPLKPYLFSNNIVSLARGMQYVFDVTVSSKGYTVETTSSPIEDWEEDDKISGEGGEMQPE